MKNHSSPEPAAHSTLLSHFCARTFGKRFTHRIAQIGAACFFSRAWTCGVELPSIGETTFAVEKENRIEHDATHVFLFIEV